MNQQLSVNLTTKVATTDGENAWTPPTVLFGEVLTLSLLFTQDVAGQNVAYPETVTQIAAVYGPVDDRPLSGNWAIAIGSPAIATTDELPANAKASDVAAALDRATAVYGAAKVRFNNGSYFISFAGNPAAAVPLGVVENTLFPVSFGFYGAKQIDGVWVHSLRLTQAPLAFADGDGTDTVLPPPPSITEVAEGGASGSASWNEIQDLFVPPNFSGTYALKIGFGQTNKLSIADTPTTIQNALALAFGNNFTVTNANENIAEIEFTGALAGQAVADLVVVPLDAGAAALQLAISFGDDTLQTMLWAAKQLNPTQTPQVTFPLELRIWGSVSGETVAFNLPVTVTAGQYNPALATTPQVNYLRSPSPKSYVPFSTTTVITAQQFNQAVVGDGHSTVFDFAHGLNTDNVFVWVRQNSAPGNQLTQAVDYAPPVIVNANNVTVTALTGAPASNAWLITVISAQAVAAFAAGLTVTETQVTGLRAELDSIEAALATLEALAPTTPLSSNGTGSGTSGVSISIPQFSAVIPRRTDLKILPGAILIGAIHTTTIHSTSTLGAIGGTSLNVYQNTGSNPIALPASYGYHAQSVAPAVAGAGGYFGSDGRRFYRLTRSGTTNSYYPTDCEVELWFVEISQAMLAAGTTLNYNAQALTLNTVGGNTRCQYVRVIEWGTVGSDSAPSTTDPLNISAVAWNATPLLKQEVRFAETPVSGAFGVQIICAANGSLSANKILYGATLAADSVPSARTFALRERLIEFDTEDFTGISAQVGAVQIGLQAGSITIA